MYVTILILNKEGSSDSGIFLYSSWCVPDLRFQKVEGMLICNRYNPIPLKTQVEDRFVGSI